MNLTAEYSICTNYSICESENKQKLDIEKNVKFRWHFLGHQGKKIDK